MSKLRLGDPINGTVGKSLGGRRYAIESRDAPKGWTVELHSKEPMEPGLHTTFWVSRIVPIKSSLTVRAGDYGRLPISSAMGARYRKGIEALLADSIDGDSLADLRSMATHIDTQDSADWLTVWRILGEPESGSLKELVQSLNVIRESRKEDPERAATARTWVVETWGERLRKAKNLLSD